MKLETHSTITSNDYHEISLTASSRKSSPSTARYKVISEHLCCDLNGEAVILSLKNGKYYGLNSVGSRIWELIQTPMSADEIESALLSEYEVDRDECRREVSEFLKEMKAQELIEVVYAPYNGIF